MDVAAAALAPTVDPHALKRAQIREAAQQFEAQFLSVMLQPMFAGIEAEGPFSGGPGEKMFQSVMTDAIGRQMTRSGGIGLADTVQREMLKMQGLS